MEFGIKPFTKSAALLTSKIITPACVDFVLNSSTERAIFALSILSFSGLYPSLFKVTFSGK